MTSAMTSFFSNDSFLQLHNLRRSPRIARSRKLSSTPTSKRRGSGSGGVKCAPHPSSSLKGCTLRAIPELYEDSEVQKEEDFHCRDACSLSYSLYPTSRHPTTVASGSVESPSNSIRSRSSSNKSIVDFELERRGEARLSAYEFSIDDTLLHPPGRKAPLPNFPHSLYHEATQSEGEFPTSPVAPAYTDASAGSPDPDSFRLTFSDVSLRFPHPPHPPLLRFPHTNSKSQAQSQWHPHHHSATPVALGSPTLSTTPSSSNSPHSSPSSHNSDLPKTPTSSDNEFFLSLSPRKHLNTHPAARPAHIKPLVIGKHTGSEMLRSSPDLLLSAHEHRGEDDILVAEEKMKEQERAWSDGEEDADSESDYDDLNDWYMQQLSDILTLTSPSSPSASSSPPSPYSRSSCCSASSPRVYAPARPDSVLSLANITRVSGEIPAVIMPSALLDPTFPRRKRTVISGSGSFLSVPAALASPVTIATRGQYRPPPRISVPMDAGLSSDVWVDEDTDNEGGPGESGFADIASRSSSPSVYSQDGASTAANSSAVNLAEFEIEKDPDMPLRLPLSLPTSPVDLEVEFTNVLANVARSRSPSQANSSPSSSQEQAPAPRTVRAVPSQLSLSMIPEADVQLEPAIPETPASHMYSPFSTSSYIFSNDNEMQAQQNRERILRSRWSSSTLSSVREIGRDRELGNKEKQKKTPSTSSRLRSYFGGSKKRASSLSTSSSSSAVVASRSLSPRLPSPSMSPVSPFFPFPSSPQQQHHGSPRSYNHTFHTITRSPSRKEFSGSQRGRVSYDSRTLNVTSVEFGAGNMVKRSASRSSTSTNASGSNSECGSCKSSGSSGLRRKPIPVDLLIKC